MRIERQRGYSLIELVIVLSVFATFALSFSAAFSSATTLVGDSRSLHRAEERLRRNMEAVANVLRGADLNSLTGFDGAGRAVDTLHFARIDTVDRQGPLYFGRESIEWRAERVAVGGVASPGRLVHVLDGTESMLASRVPQSGFAARFEGGVLTIRLATYSSMDGRVRVAQGETAISPRN